MFIYTIVGSGAACQAILFQILFATIAGAATVHKTTNAGYIPDFNFCHITSHFCYTANNFVAGNSRVNCSAPIVPGCMQITMANTTEQDLNFNVVSRHFPALNSHRF